jgi:hypothetical protein
MADAGSDPKRNLGIVIGVVISLVIAVPICWLGYVLIIK